MLQGVHGQSDPFYGIKSSESWPESELEFKYPIFNMPYTNSIIEKYNLYRSRIMRLNPNRCYTYHIDKRKRGHIPLITNDKCFFVFDESDGEIIRRYPADGNYYELNTTIRHTAINGSNEPRIHLVGVIK
jgi:hypothetical protein